MKRPYLFTLGITIVVLAAGLIFTSIQTNRKYKFKRDAEEIHSELLAAKHFMDPNTALSLIDKGDEKYVFVDIRNPRDYDRIIAKKQVFHGKITLFSMVYCLSSCQYRFRGLFCSSIYICSTNDNHNRKK